MVRHVRAVGPAVPYWDLVPVRIPTPTPEHDEAQNGVAAVNYYTHQVSSPSLTTSEWYRWHFPLAIGLIANLCLPSHRAAKKSGGMDERDLFHAWYVLLLQYSWVLIDGCQIVEPCQVSLCEPGGTVYQLSWFPSLIVPVSLLV